MSKQRVSPEYGILGLLVYLAIGLLYHLWGLETFSWTEPMLFVHLVLWPLFLVFDVLLFIIAIVAIAVMFFAFSDFSTTRGRSKRPLHGGYQPDPDQVRPTNPPKSR